jgi:hypothetical protein
MTMGDGSVGRTGEDRGTAPAVKLRGGGRP